MKRTIRVHELWEQNAAIERKLNAVLYNQRLLMRAQNLELTMEVIDMAKWDSMVAAVAAMKGAQASSNKLVEELNAKITTLATDMTDEEDQKKVEEFSAAFNEIAAQLPKAIVTDPGGSQGGIPRTE